MRSRRILLHALETAGQFALIGAALTIAYYLTAFIYDRAGTHLPGPLVLILNTLVGGVLTVLTVMGARYLFRPRSNGLFAPITEALERIATGDFSVRLDPSHHGAVGGLVQTVNQMAGKLDQLERMRQEFVSDLSHEIQSPLTSIRGFACALRRDDLSEEDRRRYLEIIEAESQRLSRLAANLLNLASLDSDQLKFEPKSYRLDTQIRDLILACETRWAEKHLEMEVTLEEASITGDEELLSQLWINLVHNSIKFTPEGGSVRVDLRRGSDRHRVSVSDTGIGIAPDDLVHIFERFYKADRARSAQQSGNGLGLAIAKRVVEIHGGVITAQSLPGTGTEFVVELPVQRPR
jgi:two-component system phosphate regulon sensor histidine kinase PhoR